MKVDAFKSVLWTLALVLGGAAAFASSSSGATMGDRDCWGYLDENNEVYYVCQASFQSSCAIDDDCGGGGDGGGGGPVFPNG